MSGDLESIQHGSDDARESMNLNRHDNSDPRKAMRLDQYYNDVGYSRKKQAIDTLNFTTSALGLIELGNVVYKKLCEISPHFAECISSSMFMYYIAQLHYMRLCFLEWKVGKTDDNDVRFMYNNTLSNRWIVPQLFADYFSCIGTFKDSAGILNQHREISFPLAEDIEGINGFFGRVDRSTHAHYENRISPGVAARRIVEDLIFTAHPRESGFWNLPDVLSPVEEFAGGPTGNLLGWSNATSLTPEQISILERSGVSLNNGQITFSHCTRFCHNEHLMNYVSAYLNELRGRVKCEEHVSRVPTGSIAQHDFQIVCNHRTLRRTDVYGDIATYNCGFTPLHMHQELFAHVFRFRMVKKTMQWPEGITFQPWCCYDFNDYRNVPNSWLSTRNSYFMFGEVKVYDSLLYKTQPLTIKLLLNKLMVKTLIV